MTPIPKKTQSETISLRINVSKLYSINNHTFYNAPVHGIRQNKLGEKHIGHKTQNQNKLGEYHIGHKTQNQNKHTKKTQSRRLKRWPTTPHQNLV